jgi:glycyl-tRNA synthetase beta chain
MSTNALLFELGCEELPATQIKPLVAALEENVCSKLTQLGLGFSGCETFATPRRLAILIHDLADQAPSVEREILGPPVASAKDAQGNWTGAAEGFARKQGLSVDDLTVIETDKGPRIGLQSLEAGAKTEDVIAGVIAEAVHSLPVSKRMRWGRHSYAFLRPVQWLVLLYGDRVLPLDLFGLHSDRMSRGHRFHHPDTLSLTSAQNYEAQLLDAKVIAHFGHRRAKIKEGVAALAKAQQGNAVIDSDLLDEVTGLVEWPAVLQGSFDPAFLEVPAQALISSMKEHQKYFHVVDDKGQLLPRFITVANIESSNPAQVIAGNERVIRPRLSDAAFFFNTDKKKPLSSRFDRLETIVFQQKLGSVADKSRRVMAVAQQLADLLGADHAIVNRGANLAKCDLVTELVLEFPELQGIAGAHYARHDGEPQGVCDIIEQHYWPKFAGDKLPASPEAACVALADRLDTLTGIFGIGQTPTGSKDPFGLRRAALAVIRLLLAFGVPTPLAELIEMATRAHSDGSLGTDTLDTDTIDTNTTEKVNAYILERLRAFYEEQGISVTVLRSVLGGESTDLVSIDGKVQALHAIAATDTGTALGAANKRIANILAKVDLPSTTTVSTEHLVDAPEIALHQSLGDVQKQVEASLQVADYAAAMAALASLRSPIDNFFDQVMVNVDDDTLRLNRLALLGEVRSLFLRLADLAELAVN